MVGGTVRTEFQSLQGKPNTHTLGALLSHSKATFGFSFRFVDRATLPDYRAPLLVLIVVVKLYDLMGTTPRPLIKLLNYP